MQPHIVPTDTTDVASLPYLRTDTDLNRDRYQNITPYEHNRFELRAPGDVLNDYINASPVSIQDRDGKARDRFLATQVGLYRLFDYGTATDQRPGSEADYHCAFLAHGVYLQRIYDC